VIKLRWGQPAAKLPFERPRCRESSFALGENPKRSNFSIPGQPRRYPATRMGVERDHSRRVHGSARLQEKPWDDLQNKARFRRREKSHPARAATLKLESAGGSARRQTLRAFALLPAKDEILMLLRVAKEFGFKVRTFQHVLEGYKVADELAAAGVGAFYVFGLGGRTRVEAYDAIPYNRGVDDAPRRQTSPSIPMTRRKPRHLNQEAAKSIEVRRPCRMKKRLKLVTLKPPRCSFGIEQARRID